MKNRLFKRGTLIGALAALGALTVAPSTLAAQSTTALNTARCGGEVFSYPFSDEASTAYTLDPGQKADDFEGTGWVLKGGAKLVSAKLADGTTGTVLDLPSGATAQSPTFCVTSAYPRARAYVNDVVGAEGISFNIEYEGTNTWGHPHNTGQIHGYSGSFEAATPVNLQPSNSPGWQPARLYLEGKGSTSNFEVYDIYIDPRLSH